MSNAARKVTCSECGGSGHVALSDVYTDALDAVSEHGSTTAQVAWTLSIGATAAYMRLSRLYAMKLVTRSGSKRHYLWRRA